MRNRLNKDQQKIFDNVLQRIDNCLNIEGNMIPDKHRLISISGAAGTGKSFLTSSIVSHLHFNEVEVICTTPTHKALHVLKEMVIENNCSDIDCRTIHSYLCLKVTNNTQTGKVELKRDYRNDIKSCDVLIIDESSMLSEELFDLIMKSLKKKLFKVVLFIGDRYQLPNPNGEINPVNDIKAFELTKIVRQAESNPIIGFATIVRKYIQEQNYLPINKYKNIIKEYQKNNLNEIKIISDFNEFMTDYMTSTNTKMVTCYTNKKVQHYNDIIRCAKYNATNVFQIEQFIKDEELVFTEAHTDKDDNIIHMNNETIQIDSLKKVKSFDIFYWEILTKKGKIVKIVDRESQQKRQENLEQLKIEAISKNNWKNYFDSLKEFQKAIHIYSCTIHKSQGSSIDDVYIDLEEIFYYSKYCDIDLIYRLLYVGYTRAKKRLILFTGETNV